MYCCCVRFTLAICLPVVFIVSNSYIHIIILFQFVFLSLLRRLMLSVFKFIFVTFSFFLGFCYPLFFSLFGHFVNFLTLKSVSPVSVLILKNSFIQFLVHLKISAKFCHLITQLPGFSPRKYSFLTSQVAPKQPKHSFCVIFTKQSELKQFSFCINSSNQCKLHLILTLLKGNKFSAHVQMFSDLFSLCSYFD